ncbi:MAG: N-acetylglucosamine-6-phosphate deacetylase [Saccharofermentans sp.]|nr:N-acetylglucosamine-6-phosphate deacetylase [Saccharofermentans sp.]
MIHLAGGTLAFLLGGELCLAENDIWFDPGLGICIPEPANTTPLPVDTIDCTGKYITPGLFDSHIHGGFGYDISNAAAEGIVDLSCRLARCGISVFLPTTMTMSGADTRKALKAVSDAISIQEDMTSPYARILGVHLEGPFLSREQAAAQNKEYLILPDNKIMRDLEEEFPGLIKIVDIAPELPGAEEFCSEFKDKYVLSAAHSEADYETAMKFFAGGGRSVTHILNAMEPCLKRAPGIPGAAYDSEGVFVEVICDGMHVEPPVLRMLFDLYEGRVIAVSDCMSAAGMPEGNYELGGAKVTVRDGKALGSNGRLAGSVTLLPEAAMRLKNAGIPADMIIDAMVYAPYRRLNIEPPTLWAGQPADINIFDEDLKLVKVFSRGKSMSEEC